MPIYTELKEMLIGKKILVTGGTGTVGQCLVRKLLEYNPEVVRVFSRDEHKQFKMQNFFNATNVDADRIRFLLGDVRDKERLDRAMENIDIVFHLAALKHVPACEYNPYEAIKTNVIGTQNVIDCAIQNGVKAVVYSSSDKAASPTNTMGASKLLAERLVSSSDQWRGPRNIKFLSVRFGNILNSRGSVVPLFREQISRGDALTVTEPSMTRFIMDMERAVLLILKSLKISRGGETFVFKMPVLAIGDLAQAVIEMDGPGTLIKYIGLRPGEKMYEELMSEEEGGRALETDDMFIILPFNRKIDAEIGRYTGATPADGGVYSSENEPIIGIEEIKEILRHADRCRRLA